MSIPINRVNVPFYQQNQVGEGPRNISDGNKALLQQVAQEAYQHGSSSEEGWGYVGMLNGKVVKFNTHWSERHAKISDTQLAQMKSSCQDLRNQLMAVLHDTYRNDFPPAVLKAMKDLGLDPSRILQSDALLKRSLVARLINVVKKDVGTENMGLKGVSGSKTRDNTSWEATLRSVAQQKQSGQPVQQNAEVSFGGSPIPKPSGQPAQQNAEVSFGGSPISKPSGQPAQQNAEVSFGGSSIPIGSVIENQWKPMEEVSQEGLEFGEIKGENEEQTKALNKLGENLKQYFEALKDSKLNGESLIKKVKELGSAILRNLEDLKATSIFDNKTCLVEIRRAVKELISKDRKLQDRLNFLDLSVDSDSEEYKVVDQLNRLPGYLDLEVEKAIPKNDGELDQGNQLESTQINQDQNEIVEDDNQIEEKLGEEQLREENTATESVVKTGEPEQTEPQKGLENDGELDLDNQLESTQINQDQNEIVEDDNQIEGKLGEEQLGNAVEEQLREENTATESVVKTGEPEQTEPQKGLDAYFKDFLRAFDLPDNEIIEAAKAAVTTLAEQLKARNSESLSGVHLSAELSGIITNVTKQFSTNAVRYSELLAELSGDNVITSGDDDDEGWSAWKVVSELQGLCAELIDDTVDNTNNDDRVTEVNDQDEPEVVEDENEGIEEGKSVEMSADEIKNKELLQKAKDEFVRVLGNSTNADRQTIKAYFAGLESETSEKVSVNEFLDACDHLGLANNRLIASGQKAAIGEFLNATKELLAAWNKCNGTAIELRTAPEFFTKDIAEKCNKLAEDLNSKGLSQTAEKLKKLTEKAGDGTDLSATFKSMQKFFTALKKFGLAGVDSDLLVRFGTFNNKPTLIESEIETQVDEATGGITGLSYSEKTAIRGILTEKIKRGVDVLLSSADEREKLLQPADVTDTIKKQVKEEDILKALEEIDKQQVDVVDNLENGHVGVIKVLTTGEKDAGVLAYESKKPMTIKHEGFGDGKPHSYKRINVEGGMAIGNNYREQCCMFHSILQGLGVDVTRKNGLILQQALTNYVKVCLDKVPENKKTELGNIITALGNWREEPFVPLSNFIRLFTENKLPDRLECINLPNIAKPEDIASRISIKEEGLLPFLASMLGRPIVLVTANTDPKTSYVPTLSTIFDIDVMTGEQIDSHEEPLTVMFATNHYQALQRLEDVAKPVDEVKIEDNHALHAKELTDILDRITTFIQAMKNGSQTNPEETVDALKGSIKEFYEKLGCKEDADESVRKEKLEELKDAINEKAAEKLMDALQHYSLEVTTSLPLNREDTKYFYDFYEILWEGLE